MRSARIELERPRADLQAHKIEVIRNMEKPIDKISLFVSGGYNVIVETPRGSRTKFAYDPETGLFLARKLLAMGFAFPFPFGFLPSTRAEDGDPLDVLIGDGRRTSDGHAGAVQAHRRDRAWRRRRTEAPYATTGCWRCPCCVTRTARHIVCPTCPRQTGGNRGFHGRLSGRRRHGREDPRSYGQVGCRNCCQAGRPVLTAMDPEQHAKIDGPAVWTAG